MEALENKTLSDLQRLCRDRNLAISGTKMQLIERLTAGPAEDGADPAGRVDTAGRVGTAHPTGRTDEQITEPVAAVTAPTAPAGPRKIVVIGWQISYLKPPTSEAMELARRVITRLPLGKRSSDAEALTETEPTAAEMKMALAAEAFPPSTAALEDLKNSIRITAQTAGS